MTKSGLCACICCTVSPSLIMLLAHEPIKMSRPIIRLLLAGVPVKGVCVGGQCDMVAMELPCNCVVVLFCHMEL